MYTILGSDQKEYGPVSADDLRRWIGEGRVNAGTLVKLVDGTDWRPLAEFSEFADALPPASPRAAPPATPAAVPTPAAARVAPVTAPKPRGSGLAIASLVLGIAGVFTCGLTALIGLVLGIVALTRPDKEGTAPSRRGLALAGTIVSAVFLLMIPVAAGVLLPALAKGKSRAQVMVCMNNSKQLCLGLLMYSTDNKDAFPAGEVWCDAVQKYLGAPTVFQCPFASPDQRSHYAFNRNLSGILQSKVRSPAATVMIFETDGGWNQSGGSELLPKRGRHNGAVMVGFADGHCEAVIPARLTRLRWEP
jgi:prepilin-type processing-associated H-X9-DG protein